MKPILYIVVPCYNEETVLPTTAPRFLEKINELCLYDRISEQSRVLFVDDGSSDGTWNIIKSLSLADEHYEGISLSRNCGHQNALLAGLMTAREKCDITISIDCDGQDDINAMNTMVDEYLNGCDVVYGIRKNREKDTRFKRVTAEGFYKLLNRLGVKTVYNHADYRLLSKKALDALSWFDEVNIYLRGMIPLVGFKSTAVYYDRQERVAGKSKYNLRKMISLALDGITSLTTKPIRIITLFGFLVAVISLVGIIWSVIVNLTGAAVSGWASTVSIICFLGGIQLISLGVIGEYVGKMYLETKHRPKYIVAETTKDGD